MIQQQPVRHLYIMRHGQAEELAGRDRDRVLTVEGQLEARQMGQWLASLKGAPRAALVSPYARARQTFELVNQSLRLPALQVTVLDELTPHGDASRIRDYLYALCQQQTEDLLVVSHMPLVSFLVELLDPRQMAPMFPTAAVARLNFDGEKGQYQGLTLPASN